MFSALLAIFFVGKIFHLLPAYSVVAPLLKMQKTEIFNILKEIKVWGRRDAPNIFIIMTKNVEHTSSNIFYSKIFSVSAVIFIQNLKNWNVHHLQRANFNVWGRGGAPNEFFLMTKNVQHTSCNIFCLKNFSVSSLVSFQNAKNCDFRYFHKPISKVAGVGVPQNFFS